MDPGRQTFPRTEAARASEEGKTIPEIGVMVGLYVVTRMLQLVTDEVTAGSVKVFGVITALVAAVVMAEVFVRGVTTARNSSVSCLGRGSVRRDHRKIPPKDRLSHSIAQGENVLMLGGE